MSAKHLGLTFDIHGGGRDLIFPHHENEVAQSVCGHGRPFVRYWVHNGFLTVNGDKMSKSLGNFRTVRELLAQAPGEAIRLALLSTQYRQPLDWTDDGLRQARTRLDGWYVALKSASGVAGGPGVHALYGDFEAALLDDLNTPRALAALDGLAGEVNRSRAADAVGGLRRAAGLLGLLQQDPEAWFKWRPETASGPEDGEIQDLIARRLAARKAKDFAEADRIRKDLAAQGVLLEDRPGGVTEWRRAG